MGPKGVDHQLGEANRRKIGGRDDRGRRRLVADPGGLHLPRPVRRPRPDLRQDQRHARRERLAGAAPAGRSPSLDLDSLYGAGPTDRNRRSSTRPTDIHLKMGKTVAFEGIGAKEGFDLPRGAGTTRRRSARRSSPIRETTRTSRSPRRTSRSSASTTVSSIRCRARCHLPALRTGPRARHQALPVDAPQRLPATYLCSRAS